MYYEIEIGGRTRRAVVTKLGDGFAVTVDGHRFHVDAVRVDAYTLSLLVDRMCSHEVGVAPDATGAHLAVRIGGTSIGVVLNGRRRTRRKDAVSGAAAGPHRVMAPMPGKVVRVPISVGESVRAGQPLVVVEAMKMENELRAGRDGTVADIHAREGMSVEAGALLVIIQ